MKILYVISGVTGMTGNELVRQLLNQNQDKVKIIVSICGLHIHTVAGAALLGTFVTSVAGVVFYQILAAFHTELAVAPDWRLDVLLRVGGMLGMYSSKIGRASCRERV